MNRLLRNIIAVLAMAVALAGRAQAPCDTAVWLVTCYPGTDIYELEGHTALRIGMPGRADYAVNWGILTSTRPISCTGS